MQRQRTASGGKKRATFILAVTLPDVNQSSKFFHRWKTYEICYKSLVTIPTTP